MNHCVIDLYLVFQTEFIHLLASEANEISERQQKKVISPEHVIEALTTLGFQEYVADVKTVHKEYKEQASVRGLALLGGFACLLFECIPQ